MAAPSTSVTLPHRIPIRCMQCGLSDYVVMYPALDMDIDVLKDLKASGNEVCVDQIVRCEGCGLIYVNPMLKPELVVEGYAAGSDETFVSQAAERQKTFLRAFRGVEKHLEKGVVVDIGTANGSFLAAARELGWDVHGVEPNAWLCNWGKTNYGISTIHPGTIFTHRFQSGFADLVTMWDVLEHVTDPRKTIAECRRILRNGGLLLVNYPDIGTLPAKMMRRKWPYILAVHLIYFDKRSLRKMLEAEGFEIVKFKNHWQTLTLGYLSYRLEKYSPVLGKVLGRFVKAIRFDDLPISYYLGQRTCIARKKVGA